MNKDLQEYYLARIEALERELKQLKNEYNRED